MISIITPTHKRPDLLYRCIKAIQRSTVQDYEHIVVADRCNKAKSVVDFVNDPRITYLETPSDSPKNVGGVGKNIGIAAAKNDLICYCDDDNTLLPNALGDFITGLSSNVECVAGKIAVLKVPSGRNSVSNILSCPFLSYDTKATLKDNRYEFRGYTYNDGLCYAHTKKLIDGIGGWRYYNDVNVNEDNDIIERIKLSTKTTYIESIIGIYYEHNGCTIPDFNYIMLVKNMQDGEIFAYPHLSHLYEK